MVTPGSAKIYSSWDGVSAHTVPDFDDAANTYLSDWVPTDGYSWISGLVYANQASSSGGFEIQQGNDSSNADYETSYTTVASTVEAFRIAVVGSVVRFKFTHNGTAPTTWRACAYLRG